MLSKYIDAIYANSVVSNFSFSAEVQFDGVPTAYISFACMSHYSKMACSLVYPTNFEDNKYALKCTSSSCEVGCVQHASHYGKMDYARRFASQCGEMEYALHCASRCTEMEYAQNCVSHCGEMEYARQRAASYWEAEYVFRIAAIDWIPEHSNFVPLCFNQNTVAIQWVLHYAKSQYMSLGIKHNELHGKMGMKSVNISTTTYAALLILNTKDSSRNQCNELGFNAMIHHMFDRVKCFVWHVLFVANLYHTLVMENLYWFRTNIYFMYQYHGGVKYLISKLCCQFRRWLFRRHDHALTRPRRKTYCALLEFLIVIYMMILCVKTGNHISSHSTQTKAQSEMQCNGKPHPEINVPDDIGGGRIIERFSLNELTSYTKYPLSDSYSSSTQFQFVEHISVNSLDNADLANNVVTFHMPLGLIVPKLSIHNAIKIGIQHGIVVPARASKADINAMFASHDMPCCRIYVTIFRPCIDRKNTAIHDLPLRSTMNPSPNRLAATKNTKLYKNPTVPNATNTSDLIFHDYIPASLGEDDCNTGSDVGKLQFPPQPVSTSRTDRIVQDFVKATSPSVFQEEGCAVCGVLCKMSNLKLLSKIQCDLDILQKDVSEFTRKERFSLSDPITCIPGPVLESKCKYICGPCRAALNRNSKPKFSLAKGLWIGDVPSQLSELQYFERLLVARVRHNRCIFRVSVGSSKVKGMSKMVANAITFKHPVQKIYTILPPPLEELDDIIAFIFTGPCQPTQEDFKRTPLLVRRKKVMKALEWLKLNHIDYQDLQISYENLNQYPEDVPPVVVDYRHSATNKLVESTSVHDMENEDGTRNGICSLTVHGLTGEEYATATPDALKAVALDHLDNKGKMIAFGRASEPESIWRNPSLYPQMFPWLFPYGLGGVGHSRQKGKLSDAAHKRHLLMYHDKRFQRDHEFCLIAFNHEQIKDSTTGGYLMTEKANFDDVATRLLRVNTSVLKDLSRRLGSGERVKPESEEEKACYGILKDIDHVGSHVNGSLTSKRYMRNQIWSLTAYAGAPSWYITLSPADNKHPMCLYFADDDTKFTPAIRTEDDRLRLISENPVAGARFFHFMISSFIEHVLCVKETRLKPLRRGHGLFGTTSAYYGTVEQQGRLTLHLHMLLWIKHSLTPQEIRDRIMDPESDFQKHIVRYLESSHVGEFLTGSHEEIQKRVNNDMISDDYVNPTESMPEPPPLKCKTNPKCRKCDRCQSIKEWRKKFRFTIDDILLRSNIHTCRGGNSEFRKKLAKLRGRSKSENEKYSPYTGCKSNKWGKCKARFPRQTFSNTMVDSGTGALNIKKGEKWMNTISPVLTYLFRCNTDVTSLLSGTAIKAVVAYIADYISKPSLKTYAVFDTICSIFDKNSDIITGDENRKENTRRILTQIVNSLTSKLEIGAPMASMYLLKNPDHYTDHKFRPFYWKSYVQEARKPWQVEVEHTKQDKIIINKSKGRFVGLSPVQDYVFRPEQYSDTSLYDWIRLFNKKSRKSNMKGGGAYETAVESDDDIVMSDPSFDDDTSDVESIHADDVEVDDRDQDIDVDDLDGTNHKEDYFEFLKDHPLCETSHVTCVNDSEGFVPDFIGGSLPRSDFGDREYYCSVMLTLFKPWRDGYDLKQHDRSWDECFTNHVFNKRQLELMKYFNLKYECLDARDDFSAQLKQGEGQNMFDAFDEGYEMDDDIHHHQTLSNGEEFDYDDEYLNVGIEIGKNTRNMMNKMDEARNTLTSSGWFDESPDGPPEYGDLTAIQPEADLNGKEWDKRVATKREEALSIRMKDFGSDDLISETKGLHSDVNDDVKIIDKTYFELKFKPSSFHDQQFIDETVTDFDLNKEQERAFRIIANHATLRRPEQLKMYIGGMGGTGKSQVIKALISFFSKRKESHRMLILAPTGSAAALLGGYTYHSALGINDHTSGAKNISQVRARLEGVDYVFIDEVSMLSCHDMYRICSQMAKAFNISDVPFGGKNVIFAGDFAQLPPVGGKEAASLYSGSIGTQIHSALRNYDQESAIGKALWHQITTVVILRKNMRQNKISPEDMKMRTALENMRYKACTPDDIAFLRTRVAGPGKCRPKLAEKRFRNISIITALNAQKDKINELGAERFARETGQVLTNFYSHDRWTEYEEPSVMNTGNRRRKKKRVSYSHKSTNISQKDQEMLWGLSHNATEHIPGKLSLCIGMPIMIRHNIATELCITKGQEGSVAGWTYHVGPYQKKVLDTLFVRLTKPPSTVKIDGLPKNVVPITKISTPTRCRFRDDQIRHVDRLQVPVLPNFGMTDYASQGKTRPNNVVELSHCQTHQSYYTALSRSATADGTVIVQSFSPVPIMGGASGWLRQEFRELELLDEITELKYLSKLPSGVSGHRRNTLINSYRQLKGLNHVPKDIHPAVRWSRRHPFPIQPTIVDSPWRVIEKISKPSTNIAIGSEPIRTSVKRKSDTNWERNVGAAKKLKPNAEEMLEISREPMGLKWDNVNYSCAYDALYSIILYTWTTNPHKWNQVLGSLNSDMTLLANGFQRVHTGTITIEQARDRVRTLLHDRYPNRFPLGEEGTSIGELICEMFRKTSGIDIWYQCQSCNSRRRDNRNSNLFVVECQGMNRLRSASDMIKASMDARSNIDDCYHCHSSMDTDLHFVKAPKIIAFNVDPLKPFILDKDIRISDDSSRNTVLTLRGLIYLGNFHFVSRIVTLDGNVWYHDGIETGNTSVFDGTIRQVPRDLWKCRGKLLTTIIYAQK